MSDNDLLGVYGIVATEMVENYLSRYLLTRTAVWTAATHHNPSIHEISVMPWQWSTFIQLPVLELPRPMTSVTSVVMGIWDQSPVTLVQDTDYQLDLSAGLGRLRWISDAFLNSNRDNIQVTFTSGYGTTQAAIPQPILHAITLMVTNLYENRGDQSPDLFSPAVQALLANYRFTYFG